jgi:hypothetical protein
MAPNAFADEIVNFTLITTSNNPTPIPVGAIGTITIDTTTGVVDGIDLNIPNPATEYSIGTDSGVVDPPTINSIYFQEQWCAGTAPACLGEGGYNIVIPVDSLVGYDGGVICSTDNPCFADTSAYTFGLETIEFTSGELRATPEPSNLLLALTGVLCFGTAIYRMRTKAVRPAGGFPI